jgi:DNA replication protein DnaC
MSDAPQILLNHRLKSLRLPTVLREYGKLAKQAAAEGLDHVQFLARLVELEMIDRERRMIERRIKAAKFPAVKSLDSFDFKAIPALNKMQVLELARCEWPYGDASIAYRLTDRAARERHRTRPKRNRKDPHCPRPRAVRLPKGPV